MSLGASCDKGGDLALPPAESVEGKLKSAEVKAEREAEEMVKKAQVEAQVEKQKNAINLDDYTVDQLEKDTEMDPYIKNALLQAKQQQADRIRKKQDELDQLMEREKYAGKMLDALERERVLLEEANKEYADIAKEQSAREATERAEKNANAPEGMVWVPGGKYVRGTSDTSAGHRQGYAEEYPAHTVEVDGFFMDATEVTNAQFAKFVEATGFKTLAEEGLKAEDFPMMRPDDLKGGANVFKKTAGKVDPWVGSAWRWWSFTPGATWRTPEGPGSSIEGKMDHPVTCVNYDDATAYAKWAGKRLPTEAEWERAARAGQHQKFQWGDEMLVGDKWQANVHQGNFPSELMEDDGFALTAPVKSYPANAWGLYDMSGNVWEICNDYFHPGYYSEFIKNKHKNPQGPKTAISDQERVAYDSVAGTCPEPRIDLPAMAGLRVARGGSFLCSAEYCLRFRPAARHHHEVMSPTQHTGFRCVK